MLILAIIILAVVLLALISKRRPAPLDPATDEAQRQRDRAANDGPIIGEAPGGLGDDGKLPEDFTPGGGDFGGGGSSSSWDGGATDSGDAGGD